MVCRDDDASIAQLLEKKYCPKRVNAKALPRAQRMLCCYIVL
jgi:hypothetical protein